MLLLKTYKKRFIIDKIYHLLKKKPVLLINGGDLTSKTRLVQKEFTKNGFQDIHFLRSKSRDQALLDPLAFVNELNDKVVFDSIHRVPKILDVLPKVLSNGGSKKQYVLLSSNRSMKTNKALSKYANTIEIRTLAQCEWDNSISTFIHVLFNNTFKPKSLDSFSVNKNYKRIYLGGYPHNRSLKKHSQNYKYHYFLKEISAVHSRGLKNYNANYVMKNFIKILAHHSSDLLEFSKFELPHGIQRISMPKFFAATKETFFIDELPAFQMKNKKGLDKTPRVYFNDTGMMCYILDLQQKDLVKGEETSKIERIFKTFVYQELMKLCAMSIEDYQLTHFLDKKQNQVDFIISNSKSKYAAIKIRNKPYVEKTDFNSINMFQKYVGNKFFVNGIVIYNGDYIKSFGDKKWAIPLQLLWELDQKVMKY